MNRSILAFLSSAFLALLAVNSATAQATPFDRRVSAFYCAPYNSDDQWGAYSMTNLSTTTSKSYVCPVPNDSRRNLTQVHSDNDAIKVYGSAIGSRNIVTWACVSYYSAAGGTCSASADNGDTTGAVVISPSRRTWADMRADDTPYIGLSLLHCQVSGSSCVGWNLVRGVTVKYADL